MREAMRAVYEEQEELLARAAAAGRTPSARAPQSAAGSSQEMHHNPHQGQPPDSVQLLMSTTAAFERRLEAIVSDFERRIAAASAAPTRSPSTLGVAACGTGGSAPIAEVVREIAAELELGERSLSTFAIFSGFLPT